jgi:peptidoglycan/xylan/chitin deacetylase (PgdA/CDA1 family)
MRKHAVALLLLVVFVLVAGGLAFRAREARELRETARAAEALARRAEKQSGEIVWRVPTRRKVVALTFDDGPDPKYTPAVLALARRTGIKLTFFLVGREIRHYPDLAKQEAADGHAIGNHTWSHPVLTSEGEQGDLSELERCEDEIERICGGRTHLFRPPKGRWDGDTFVAAAALGYRMILWSVALEHHDATTPEAMAQRVLNQVTPGMIILAHDGAPNGPVDRSKTMRALPLLVDGLRAEGYKLVTVPELMQMAQSEGLRQAE